MISFLLRENPYKIFTQVIHKIIHKSYECETPFLLNVLPVFCVFTLRRHVSFYIVLCVLQSF